MRSDRLQKRFGVRRQILVDEHLSLSVEDADIHGLRVQIDSAPMLMRVVVKSHRPPSCADARYASSLLRVE
jgi:hypothetical protein